MVCGCNMTNVISPFCPTAGHIIEAEQMKLATKTEEMRWKSTTHHVHPHVEKTFHECLQETREAEQECVTAKV